MAGAHIMSRIVILQLMIVQCISGNIVRTPEIPEVNQTATISCFVPDPRFWYLPVGGVQCNTVECDPDAYGSYTFRADPSKTDFIFQSLNRTRDERVWTCKYQRTNYSISLLIYTIPRGLDLTQTPDINADLVMTSITIQCRTTSCTYPEPSIEWLYKDQSTSNMYEMYTRTIPSSTQGPCILPEKIYTGSIYIAQNTTWSDNSDKTVTFFCRIGYSDPMKNKTSLASRPVSFAVRVTEAFLQNNNQNITSTLNVTAGDPVNVTCRTSTSRPAPNIDWYIGSRTMGSGTSLIFTPSNTDHNEVIYCQAYNIDPNLKVVSNKPSLFVRVRVTEALLQHNNQNITSTLTVTSGEQVTLTCLTSTSRPAPNIDWYIGSQLVGNGTSLIFTPNNTNHNNVIYCQAYNPSPKVDSNKVNLFVRVYVSWITLDGSAGGTIVFNEGYPQTLKCISSPSRPVPIIRWLLGNKQVTYNITNSDIMDANGLHVLTSEIKLVLMRNSSNQKVYCEGFISDQGTIVMSTQVNVDVLYAPDVKVNISGSTVVGSAVVLMCTPQGNPSNYTFHAWIHMVGQTEVRRLDGVNAVRLSTLTLSNISIQDMGTYICTVSNSITGLDGQIIQKGNTNMYAQGLPVLGATQSTFFGETNNSMSIEIPFYSYFSVKTVKFRRRLDSFEISNSSDVFIYISPSKIPMVFYKINVTIPGHVAVLHFRNLKDTDFGNYSFEVSNDQGTTYMQFDFNASAPPSIPKNFFFSHTEGSLLVFGIEKGFNGGHEQTFIIEYQPFGMSEAAWSTIFKVNENDLDDPFSNGTYYFKIPKIHDGQYIFRVYAENKKGNTSIIGGVHVEITTELPSPVMNDVPVGAVVGGVVGTIVVVIAIVAVAFVVKRRTLRPKMEAFEREDMDSADGKHQESRLKDNPVYDSSESGPVVQEYAAVVKPKKMFGRAEDSSKLYAQVEKTNKNKRKTASKGKLVKIPRGDIYENNPLPMKLSGENVYENPGRLAADANSSENVYENPDASVSKGQLVNKDGLLYADLKLGPPSTKAGKPVIHGLENQIEYAEIAYGKRGEPLPESDEEKESGGAKNDGTKSSTDE